jgi:hypothetical protein
LAVPNQTSSFAGGYWLGREAPQQNQQWLLGQRWSRTGQHAIDHAEAQSRRTTERIDKAGLWPSSLFGRGFSAIRAIFRSRVKVFLLF